ncbi:MULTISPECIES: hypothetical protein [unclassified Mesorhizobium]|uniref:hypothetical protein n=1 Tax=unclassified Mesorhizobium TaxID=325217 RepID=UPI00301467D2
MISYADACRDDHLFGPWFNGPTWNTWSVLDRAIFGDPLTPEQLAIFTELTGRTEAPTAPCTEAWLVMGRRSGKDVKIASIITYLATIGAVKYGYLDKLVRGETAVAQLFAMDRKQAKVCLSYTKAFFEQPMLEKLVARDTADGLELTNGITIEITTNDYKSARGRSVVAAVLDECAFYASENTANPDEELYRAIKPSMATIPNAMLFGISSPHARKGLLWRKYKDNFGKTGSSLIVQAPTWRMNPTVPRDGDFLREREITDPASFVAEFGAQFRTDVESYVSLEAVEACVEDGCYERPRIPGVTYFGAIDPAGGSGTDSMTAAVSHREGETVVIDAIREIKPPFSPQAATKELADFFRSYGLQSTTGDRYGGDWPREQMRLHGIDYKLSPAVRTDLYVTMLPAINSGRVSLLDNKKMVTQLVALERKNKGGGKLTIDHPQGPNSHDDVANVVALATYLALKQQTRQFNLSGPLVLTKNDY